jgi:hypothetical protein
MLSQVETFKGKIQQQQEDKKKLINEKSVVD